MHGPEIPPPVGQAVDHDVAARRYTKLPGARDIRLVGV